jgi:hypothetical protein
MPALRLAETDPLSVAVLAAIHTGDVAALDALLRANPGLASATITRGNTGSREPFSYPLIGAAVDWPGHFPNVNATIELLVAAGADVNARCGGPHSESPLHGAASSDDVAALDTLLDAGADLEAPGAVIAGGTPLDDAVAFGQWQTARRLVERGAQTAVWHAAALGLQDRVEAYFNGGRPPARHPWGGAALTPADDVQIAFWSACHGGQRAVAEYLLGRGADLDWVAPWDRTTPLDVARRGGDKAFIAWLEKQAARSANTLAQPRPRPAREQGEKA